MHRVFISVRISREARSVKRREGTKKMVLEARGELARSDELPVWELIG